MTFYEKIYNYSPLVMQNWMLSIYGRKLARQRYGAMYESALSDYLNKEYHSIESEKEVQKTELLRLLSHAVDNSAFYTDLYRGIDIDEINHVEDLSRLPIVEKESLRQDIDRVYTIPLETGVQAFTGGTTGKSLRVVYTLGDFQRRMAYLDAFKIRCGADPRHSTKATFSGRPVATGLFQGKRKKFWRDNSAYKQRLYSTFDLTAENIPHYIADLNEYSPDIINGFVSAIHQIASYALSEGVEIRCRPKAIFSTSETLLDHHRDDIENAFGARVFNQYASAEGAPFITECVEGNLHYNIDTGVIESQDFGLGPEMLVTSFTTYGTPLIRYRIGDGIRFKEGSCRCGHCHPLVSRIEGRNVDYLISSDRGRVSLSHLADVIKGLPNCVREMQFIQTVPDEITVRMVVDEAQFGAAAKKMIVDEMQYRFGDSTRVVLDRVQSIEREPSGKFALIKNQISQRL